jgi:DNA-binding NarL/FixJ family response regulator
VIKEHGIPDTILVRPDDSVLRRMIASLQATSSTSPSRALTPASRQTSAPAVIVIDAMKSLEAGIAELRSMRLRYKGESKYLLVSKPLKYDEFIMLVGIGMDGNMRLQDVNLNTIDRVVHALLAGEFVIPRHLIGSLVSVVRASQPGEPSQTTAAIDDDISDRDLTAREKNVLLLLSEGARSREIAELLAISLATVNKHIQHIFNKLQVHSRTGAMRKVMDQASTGKSQSASVASR